MPTYSHGQEQIYYTKWNRFRAKAYAKVFLPIENCGKMLVFVRRVLSDQIIVKRLILLFSGIILPKHIGK